MARQAQKLTKAKLDRLRRQAQADPRLTSYLADAGQPGLGVRVRRGRVTFIFTFRPPGGGARRRMAIDDYGAITLDKAREIAQQLRGQVAERIDPQQARAEEQRRAVSVAAAVEGYLTDFRERAESGAEKGKRSGYASAKRRLERHVVPELGSLCLRDVASDHVKTMHRKMKATPVEANRTLAALAAVFGWAAPKLVPLSFNPAREVVKYRETGKRRALTNDEMKALGSALHEAEESGGVEIEEKLHKVHRSAVLAVRLLALTGFRRADVIGHTSKNRRGRREGLRWSDVDLDAGLIHLRDSKTGKQTRVIGAAAVELLRAAKPKMSAPGDPVCPGTVQGQPFIGIDKARRKLWKAAGVLGTPAGRADLHSLRHSFASIGAHAQSGRYVGMIAPLLGHGHQARAITERYITADPEGQRPAADAIAGEIAGLLGLGEPGRVIAFPGLER